ncbi:MAG: Binding-protein-dependent transport systems inner membrane component [Acetothermia bacterium 64_32]|nr:MAG: Binding-protein-dependent transport systems inner membrane component [Acetothermia bacterium 64_32]HAF70160.1 ABC transporter permease [Candidatus Acetothermia bacterium]
MWAYIARRVLVAIPTLLAVYTLVFLFVRVAPGDPAVAALGDYASKEAVEALRQEMGLTDPLWVQYLRSLLGYLKGDLGRSLINRLPVSRQVAAALPYTLELTFAGILLGALIGIPTGVLTALRRNRLPDYLGRTLSLVGLSIPAFYLGILLMIAFSIKLRWFPVMGGGNLSSPADNLRHLALPALSLGIIMTSYVTRMTRSSVLNVLQEDYVRTARAKGLRERAVTYSHVLRNALIPIASVVGVYSVVLIGDSVMTEVVFSRPGLGKLMVGAMLQRDYIALQSLILIYAGFVILINLLTDLSYGLIDPRVRYD